MVPDPALVRGVKLKAARVAGVNPGLVKYTLLLFAVQTVWPVAEFEAQELIASEPVGITVFVTRVPSTLTTETPGGGGGKPNPPQKPFGTYAITLVPLCSTETELDGWHEPTGGGGAAQAVVIKPLLKLSRMLASATIFCPVVDDGLMSWGIVPPSSSVSRL